MEPTRGAQDEEYVKAHTESVAVPTQSEEKRVGIEAHSSWGKGLADAGDVVSRLSEKPDFAALLVSIIGYVVISSFGGIKTFGEFLMYIFFLFFAFLMYKLLNSDFDIKDIEVKDKLYLAIILVLVIIIIGTNLSDFENVYNIVMQFLSKSTSKPNL